MRASKTEVRELFDNSFYVSRAVQTMRGIGHILQNYAEQETCEPHLVDILLFASVSLIDSADALTKEDATFQHDLLLKLSGSDRDIPEEV